VVEGPPNREHKENRGTRVGEVGDREDRLSNGENKGEVGRFSIWETKGITTIPNGKHIGT
jgi:hypothetical protein